MYIPAIHKAKKEEKTYFAVQFHLCNTYLEHVPLPQCVYNGEVPLHYCRLNVKAPGMWMGTTTQLASSE